MNTKEMDLQQYCGLNRPRFRFDPEADAAWYFGNREVSKELVRRVRDDFIIRGVPKCGVVGRFGAGKTHTLFHLKYLFETDPGSYPARPFLFRIGPYDESTPGLGGWAYIHGKMLDSMGEEFIRDIVRRFDNMPDTRTQDLAEAMAGLFRFGPENLRRSLASVLAAYFLRDIRSTLPAWRWLRGQKLSGQELPDVGVTMTLEHAGDMIDVILNLGVMHRTITRKAVCFLMDEGQALGEVDKREAEIHDAFLQLAEPDNEDVGFVLAYFGTGQSGIPPVISTPDDILSRLDVTSANINDAFIDLRRIITSKEDMNRFMLDFLSSIRDADQSAAIVQWFDLAARSRADLLPFEETALNRMVDMLFQMEQLRNPRMIIANLARVAAAAYQRGKGRGEYSVADTSLVNEVLSALG
jgi:hypothetical protein